MIGKLSSVRCILFCLFFFSSIRLFVIFLSRFYASSASLSCSLQVIGKKTVKTKKQKKNSEVDNLVVLGWTGPFCWQKDNHPCLPGRRAFQCLALESKSTTCWDWETVLKCKDLVFSDVNCGKNCNREITPDLAPTSSGPNGDTTQGTHPAAGMQQKIQKY